MLGEHNIKSGKSCILRVIYRTDKRPGRFKKKIYLTTNSPGQEDVTLVVMGEVKAAAAAKIKIRPRKINLGPVPSDFNREILYYIANEGQKPLVITGIRALKTGHVYFERGKGNPLTVQPGEELEYKIVFRASQFARFPEIILFECNARDIKNGAYAVMVLGPSKK